ncbi:ThuA domain-containing protein [Emticicia sp. C21]|uniref:ThuA domain-containing protein n=1 Tax=Emticicia sp. C21 TaxID=2302915 RepID=UPI001E41109D|nr:ThuA domain-containing protein [Emticicia sp. C21]
MKLLLTPKALLVLILALCFSASSFAQRKQFRVLLFSKTDGFHHESINEGVTAIKAMAERQFFSVNWQETLQFSMIKTWLIMKR